MNNPSLSRSLCESCVYFHEQVHLHEQAHFLEQDKGQGRCHRYPPSFTESTSGEKIHQWQFPLVHIHSWCGEHLPTDLAVKVSLKNH